MTESVAVRFLKLWVAIYPKRVAEFSENDLKYSSIHAQFWQLRKSVTINRPTDAFRKCSCNKVNGKVVPVLN